GGTVGHQVAGVTDDDAIAAGVVGSDVDEGEGVARAQDVGALSLEPLICQARTRGDDAEASGAAGASVGVRRRGEHENVRPNGERGAVGYCGAASASDDYAIAAGIGGSDVRESEGSASSQQVRPEIPLIAQTRS